jgi:hypothetical protein
MWIYIEEPLLVEMSQNKVDSINPFYPLSLTMVNSTRGLTGYIHDSGISYRLGQKQ